MDKFNFMNVANALNNSLESGVSFEGRSMKWETAEDVKSLIEEIDNCKSLIYMNLDGNTLGVEAAARIGEALKKHPEFKKALWKNLFTGRLKEEIPKALESLGQGLIAAGACLTVFDCSDNALGPNGMSGLVNLLSSAACFSLQELRLNNCGLGIGGSRMLANALFKCYEKSCGEGRPLQLRVFVAGRNRLENEGAKALAKVFAAVKTLEEVAIPQNGIYHEGIAALSEAFRENENMQVLDLADNTIKPKGAAALASVLHCMPKLREIHFADALLKTKGAMILGDALQDNHTQLEVLNLGFNEIRSDGGYAILTALQNKTKLKSVQLNGNALGEKCCLELLELIHSNPQATGSFSEDEGDEASDDEDENTNENVEDDEDEETEDEDDENYGASDEENYTGGEIDEEEAEGFNYVTALNGKSFETTYDESFNSNSSVYYAGEESRPNTVETFFNTPNPSLTLFNSLEEGDKLEAMRNLLKRYKDDDYLIALVFTTLKCAALAKESQEALDMAVSLFQDTFDYAESTRQIARVKNFILIQLGLLKSEDKKFRPTYNLQSCRFALQETITKHTVPEDVKKTFELFLERFA